MPRKIGSVTGSFDKTVYFIDDSYVLRPSRSSMADERDKYRRVENLPRVPGISFEGEYDCGEVYQYTALSMLPGVDLLTAVSSMTKDEQRKTGKAVAQFLDILHEIRGTSYDIGHYIPVIGNFAGTWREGHKRYWNILEESLGGKMHEAFVFLRENSSALDYSAGPALLHNDFHPKNIIVDSGDLSGVIDWECSQYGEADFDLCHLIHWCLYPPVKGVDLRHFLGTVIESAPRCAMVPDLAKRLTIYQVEHELIQTMWKGEEGLSGREARLRHWMAGGVEKLFAEFGKEALRQRDLTG